MAGLVVGLAAPAIAHPTTSFSACTAPRRAADCVDTGFFGDWQRVWIRGRVSGSHSRVDAVLMVRRPRSQTWQEVDTVRITDLGRMRFVWEPTEDDFDPSKPYRFRFRIPGHGWSEITEAYVGRTPAEIAVQASYSVLGVRYVLYSGIPENGLDCSGLTEWSWAQAGVDLPGSASLQYRDLRRIRLSNVRPGDLIYYSSASSHIAMYVGHGKIIHTTGPGDGGVRIDSMYGYDRPLGAVRVD